MPLPKSALTPQGVHTERSQASPRSWLPRPVSLTQACEGIYHWTGGRRKENAWDHRAMLDLTSPGINR